MLVRDSEVKVTRDCSLRRTPLSCGVCSAAVILDGLKFVNHLNRRGFVRGRNCNAARRPLKNFVAAAEIRADHVNVLE